MILETQAIIAMSFLTITGGIVILFNKWSSKNFKKINFNYLVLSSIRNRRFKVEMELKELEMKEKQLISINNFSLICQKLNQTLRQKIIQSRK